MLEYQSLTKKIIGRAIEVHRILGPGLLESAYQKCLFYELVESGLSVKQEIALPIKYKDITLDHGYRIDLLVEDKVIIELKATSQIHPIHESQILTYLRLGNFPVGLLLNFNVRLLKEGIHRFIHQTSP